MDSKTLLFEAISYYEFRSEYWNALMSYSAGGDGKRMSFCSYSYDFTIDSIGRIKIGRAKTISTDKKCTPDKEEGFYIFSNGQYKKE